MNKGEHVTDRVIKSAEQILKEVLEANPISFVPSAPKINFDALVVKTMKLYAKQFIDLAGDIINPACDLLPKTYDKELEVWFEEVSKNKLE